MAFHFKIGLKLYSTNVSLISEAKKCKEEGFFNYIELYIIPGTYEGTIDVWKGLNIPFIIHAPHSVHGINLALESQWKQNRFHFTEAQKFSDALNSEIIIIHGGHSGKIEEMMRQVESLNDHRIYLENKPKIGLNDEQCIGCLPSEFQRIIDSGVLRGGVVLDFVHASCAAFSLGLKPMELVRSFLVFKPKVFHLSDGDPNSESDKHLNIGNGGFNVIDFLSVIPEDGLLTLETPRDPQNGLSDFVKDVNTLHELICKEDI